MRKAINLLPTTPDLYGKGHVKLHSINQADPSFPDQLNDLYSRFDKLNTLPEQRPLPTDTPLAPPFTVNVADVRTLFKRVSTRKTSGPDNISSYTFKNCTDQLAPVFTDIYNSSLQQCIVPTCFKTSVIIPIPKKASLYHEQLPSSGTYLSCDESF